MAAVGSAARQMALCVPGWCSKVVQRPRIVVQISLSERDGSIKGRYANEEKPQGNQLMYPVPTRAHVQLSQELVPHNLESNPRRLNAARPDCDRL